MQNLDTDTIYYWTSKYNLESQILDYLKTIVSAEELAKSLEYSSTENKNKYVYRTGILKILLSYLTGMDISFIQVLKTEYGKPFITKQKENDQNVRFNYSSSEDFVLYTFSTSNDVGCDIMYNDHCKNININADDVFSDNDITKIYNSRNNEIEICRLWTKKEALIKCVGTGFTEPELNTIDLSNEIIQHNSLDKSGIANYYMFTSDKIVNYTFSIAAKMNGQLRLKSKEMVFENELSDAWFEKYSKFKIHLNEGLIKEYLWQ